MRIKSLETKNFRTLEDFKLSFNSYYTAISGKNNAGKSNILRLIQELLQDTPRIRIRGRSMGVSQFNWMEDVTSWNIDRKDDITICATFEINRDSDASIYKFLTDFIVKEGSNLPSEETKTLKIGITKKPSNLTQYSIFVDDVEITDDYSKKEFLMRFRSADCLSYYNSTMRAYNPFEDDIETVSDFLSSTDLDEINKKKEDLIKLVSKNLKSHQQELTQWLGKLEEKYEVCLSIQGLNFEKEPIDISLKEKGGEVLLDNWGSGTRNRTLIFFRLLNAVKKSQTDSETDRVKPIVIIEEPESFLHPQAQVEFGQILQGLANELKIQVIITTHSPYFLSYQSPADNILLTREKGGKPKTTIIQTEGDDWACPFVNVLGINIDNLGPMKDVVFGDSKKILLVEGEIDKKYLQYFQQEIHGGNALTKDIEIFPVGGADSYKNTVWINFVKSRYKKVGILIDKDRFSEAKKSLITIGFKENTNLFSVGTDDSPYIEGLVPNHFYSQVSSENPDITKKLLTVNKDMIKSGRSQMKTKLLDKLTSSRSLDGYDGFYALIKKLNKYFR